MNPVGIRELKANLSEYVERARNGERIVVSHRGKPVVQVVALDYEDPMERGIREGWITPGKGNLSPLEILESMSEIQLTGEEDPVEWMLRDREEEYRELEEEGR